MKQTWRIKDAVLVLVSALCLFLLLHALRVFSFSAGGGSESYAAHARKRIDTIGRSAVWNIFATPPDSAIGLDTLGGIQYAVTIINEKGGVLGKSLVLHTNTSVYDFEENKFTVQEICDNEDAALLIGPWFAAEVPSARAVTQFHALPLVSVSPAETLPVLEPDLYFSLLPDLATWAVPLSRTLQEKKYRRILIIGPEKPHYSGILAEKLEEAMRLSNVFEDIFRSDYAMPADTQTLYRRLKLYQDNMNLDAVVFMGDDEELRVLDVVLRDLGIQCPVYGSDELDMHDLDVGGPDAFPGGLFYIKTRGNIVSCDVPEAVQYWDEKEQIWGQYGFMSMMLFKEAMEKNGSYNPELLVASMREIWQTLLRKNMADVKVSIVPFIH
jgi:ABC-type branched-subunit amino acid transport system substrate-binding protein